MNIYIELNKIIAYIEDNLEEKIEYKDLAKMIGVNENIFQKIFSLISNVTISEYIRNRRMSNAGQDLFLQNEKVIDIAIKYQYNNATAFSRAFEKFHGIKPSKVKKNPEKLKMYTKLHFNETNENSKNIEYRIIERDKFVLYGKYISTDNTHIGKEAPLFYQEVEKQYGAPKYGLVEYKEKERINTKSYWVAYDRKIEGLQKKVIPKGKWVEMRIDSQNAKEIQEVSNLFYCDFLRSCKYNFRNLPEIEYYHDGVTDFLVPIED